MRVFVRINSATELARQDVVASVGKAVFGLVVPKVDTPAQLAEHEAQIARAEADAGLIEGRTRLIALLETPKSIFHALSIAESSSRLIAIGFGVEDYAATIGLPPEPQSMAFAAQTVATAAHAAGIEAIGLPGSIAEFRDMDALRRIALMARQLGFTGSGCIHPAQVPIFNEAFGVSEQEAAEAKEVIEAYERARIEGLGAIAIRGRMIDIPIYERAMRTIQRAEHSAT